MIILTPPMAQGPHSSTPIRFQWKAPEVPQYERTVVWYTLFGVFVLAMIFIGILTQSWPMALVFLLLAGVYILVQLDEHELLDVLITDMGVQVGQKFFPYGEMEAFYVLYTPKARTLHFLRKGRLKQHLVLQLEDMEPSQIAAYLSRQLPELAGVKEHFVDRLIRLFKL